MPDLVPSLYDWIALVFLLSLAICFIPVLGLIRLLRKRVNENYKEVKDDIWLLNIRTKDLPDPKVSSHYIRPRPYILGDSENE